ncbi:MAG: hypothetical protein JSV30_02245 [Candidatus Omnitrophota bacterium]|nr:MAG: hypothetical protein JSV30_02245 [Candidatus Omnitrophota bacterium]
MALFLIIIALVSCPLAPGVFGRQEDIDAESQAIDLNEAQKIAEEYLDLLKQNKFEQAFDMIHMPNYNPENRDIDLEAAKLLNEGFGNIIGYKFKDSEWHKPLFHYHWDPDEIPLKDEPVKIKEPPYLSLIYEIEYRTATGEKEIQVVSDKGILKIQKAVDTFTSPGAILKMMNLMKKLPKKAKDVER